jgi:uncharacterized protein (DUF1778 family)
MPGTACPQRPAWHRRQIEQLERELGPEAGLRFESDHPELSDDDRIEEERRTLIDRAAEAAGKDRTQFVLDAATREAITVLLDQRYFQLDTDAFAKFNAALDASPAENPRLRQRLSGKAPWER